MIDAAETGASPRDFLRVLFRHKWKALLFASTVFGSTLAYTIISKKVYRSEAKLFVRLGRENVAVDPTATAGQQALAAVPFSREMELASVQEILQSRGVMEAVVERLAPATILEKKPETVAVSESSDNSPETSSSWSEKLSAITEKLGLTENLPEREQAIQQLLKVAEVTNAKKSNVISVAYEARSPEAAQAVVKALVEACEDQHIRANRPRGSYEFLAKQTDQLKSHLQEMETQLRDLKTQTGLASVIEQRKILVDRIGKLEDESLTTTAALSAAEAQVYEMKETLEQLSPELITARTTGFPNVAADTMRSQLYALQVKEKELKSKFRDDHPEVVAIRAQIVAGEAIVNAEDPQRVQETKGPNHLYETARTNLLSAEPLVAALRAKSDSLQKQIAMSRSGLESLNDSELQISRLQREVELAEGKYRKYSDNVEQARLDEALETGRLSNLSLAQPATLDPKAVKPKKAIILALGAFVAMFGAMALAFISEYFDHSLKTSSDVEQRLELPMLASISQLQPRQPQAFMGRIRS